MKQKYYLLAYLFYANITFNVYDCLNGYLQGAMDGGYMNVERYNDFAKILDEKL